MTYRTGEHNARNIYRDGANRDSDEHVAVTFAPEFARFIVHRLNSYLRYGHAYDALYRIAQAHQTTVDAAGGVSGYCAECEHPWPCPTNRWARLTVTDSTAPWDAHDTSDADTA